MKKKLIILFLIIAQVFITSLVKAESFTWPSDGYIGWKYYTDTAGQEGISGTYHTGIDIWSNTDKGWNGGVVGNSNPVYSAYPGQVVYTDSLGLIIKHTNTLYTKYWHIRNRQVSTNTNVDTSSLLGYQDYANAVHVHVTVASSSAGYDTDYTLDPTGYFGVQLRDGQPGAVGWMYPVSHSFCSGANVVITNQNINGPKDCGAATSITINPTTTISAAGGSVTLHVP